MVQLFSDQSQIQEYSRRQDDARLQRVRFFPLSLTLLLVSAGRCIWKQWKRLAPAPLSR